MIVDLKPYPAIKNSGVPWLGEVPEHWDVLALKRLGWFKGGAGFPVEQQGQRGLEVPFFKVSDMNLPGNGNVMSIWNNAVSRSTATTLGATIFPPGTIVFPKVGGAMLTNKRRLVERPCCIDNNLMGCIVRRGNPHFLLLVLQYLDFATIAKPGPVPAISEGEVREIRIALPTLSEQAAIVRFLDHVDRRIRRYIHAKQKLIKLLDEQKRVIIYRAVTRGLDPNIRLKSSGVDWLGDVPEHWSICRAKLLLRQVVPPIPPDAEMVTCFRDGQVTLRRNRRTEGFTNAIKELGYQGIRPGQLVLHSMDAFAGAIGVSDSAGKCSPEYVICEPAVDCVMLGYYAYLLQSLALRGLFVMLCPSVRERAPRVRFSHFGAFVLPNPPLVEQEEIVDHIRLVCRELDVSLNTTRREIDLLHEYRTRLIADVVTGKLDVRQAAAQLPDEVDEAEPLEDAEADTDVDPGAADELDAITEEAEA